MNVEANKVGLKPAGLDVVVALYGIITVSSLDFGIAAILRPITTWK